MSITKRIRAFDRLGWDARIAETGGLLCTHRTTGATVKASCRGNDDTIDKGLLVAMRRAIASAAVDKHQPETKSV